MVPWLVVLDPPIYTQTYHESRYGMRVPAEVYRVLVLDDEEEYYFEGRQLQSLMSAPNVGLVVMEDGEE